MGSVRAHGYGADLEITGDAVVIYPGKIAAAAAGTDAITVPIADLERVDYRAANVVINGEMRLRVRLSTDDNPTLREAYAARKDAGALADVRERSAIWQEQFARYGAQQPNKLTPESLVVHWRKKDQGAFEQIHAELSRRIRS